MEKLENFFFLKFCKIYEGKKTGNWNNSYIAQFIDTMHCKPKHIKIKPSTEVKTYIQI